MKRLCARLLVLGLCLPLAAQAAEVQFNADGPLAGQGLPFSESVRVGDLLFLSGQIGSKDGVLVEGGIEAETRQTLENIRASLKRQNLGLADVVKCTVFLADIGEWGRFNSVYTSFFQPPFPARSALGSSGLAMDARVEVECIAAFR